MATHIRFSDVYLLSTCTARLAQHNAIFDTIQWAKPTKHWLALEHYLSGLLYGYFGALRKLRVTPCLDRIERDFHDLALAP